MRLDKYLKVSRIIKRRSVASDAASAKRINVNGKVAKPSHTVCVGDVIEIRFGNEIKKIKVLSLKESVRKEDAIDMYEDFS